MVVIALPFFFFALYEKNGLKPEQIIRNVLKVKFLTPSTRPYKSINFYRQLHEELKQEEARFIEQKE